MSNKLGGVACIPRTFPAASGSWRETMVASTRTPLVSGRGMPTCWQATAFSILPSTPPSYSRNRERRVTNLKKKSDTIEATSRPPQEGTNWYGPLGQVRVLGNLSYELGGVARSPHHLVVGQCQCHQRCCLRCIGRWDLLRGAVDGRRPWPRTIELRSALRGRQPHPVVQKSPREHRECQPTRSCGNTDVPLLWAERLVEI